MLRERLTGVTRYSDVVKKTENRRSAPRHRRACGPVMHQELFYQSNLGISFCNESFQIVTYMISRIEG